MFGFRDGRLYLGDKPLPVTEVQVTIWFSEGQLEDNIRHIVREEMAELVPVDVPDAPPEDLR